MMKKSLWLVCFAACFLLTAPAAFGQICGPEVREQFAQAVLDGWSDQELEDAFGYCRDDLSEPLCVDDTGTTSPDGTDAALGAKSLGRTLFYNWGLTGSTWYEDMVRCGYHPQNERLACIIELKQRWGFGWFGANPWGSWEHVRVCLDCDRNGTFEWSTTASVHVTDDISGSTPRWYFTAIASTNQAPALCTANDGQATNVRAILSWSWVPRNCNSRPFWGRTIDFTARRDP